MLDSENPPEFHYSTPSKPYGFYPYSKPRMAWEYIMFASSLIIIWQIPFECFFNLNRTFLYIFPSLIIDLFFLADIYIVYHTGTMEFGVLNLDKASIFKRIPKWRKIIYWLCPWPYYLIGWFINNDTTFCCLLFLSLIRVFRLYDSINVIHNTLVYINPVSTMTLLFTLLLTVVHYSACIFWYTGHVEIPNNSWLTEARIAQKPYFIQYFHSVYYITTTILTIGYGDLYPVTFREVCVVICVEAFGVFCYQFVVSNLVSIVADPSHHSFNSKYTRISSSFEHRHVSASAMRELLTYFEYVWEKDRNHTDFYETASKLPEGLQKRLALALHSNVFSKVNALRGASEEILEKVSIALRPKVFTPGDFIMKTGKISNKIYFITEGKVSIVSPGGSILSRIDGLTGAVLGEASMINGTEEVNSAIALTYVEAFELLKEDFDDIVEAHPQFQDRLVQKPSLPKIPTFQTSKP